MLNGAVDQEHAVPDARQAQLSLPQRALVMTYLAVAVWYLAWRPTSFNPDALTFSIAVYAAELFGFVCAALYLFMCWRLQRRTPPPVPEGVTADVFVPTINESVDLVRRTVMAAQRMAHVGEVWLLDDGNRAEMKALATQLGCRYLARTQNTHAKAGNLNHALAHCKAEFIAIFDADHAPAPGFLAHTLGFLTDPRVAFVQTPQDFYNLDSFQHRVDRRSSVVWSEQMLFFQVIQPGKDRLNSAFFCGSCAVVRRAAIEDVGGFATGTVTEDIHTSLRLHKRGWKSVFYGRSLAFGLAPATATTFLRQRLRWGQGAMQTWRQEGVLTARGLTVRQRLSYMGTILAYFEGWQRLILFLSPVAVLATGVMPIAAVDSEFLIRFVPYFLLNYWAFEEVARGFGRSLLNEQYTMARFAIFINATFGYFLRRLRFVVTPKKMGEADATRRTLWPQYTVLVLNVVAIPIGIFVHWPNGDLVTGALVANVIWASMVALLAASAIRFAVRVSAYRRREYRFPLPVPFRVRKDGGEALALVSDISPSGCRISRSAVQGDVGSVVEGELLLPNRSVSVRARVRSMPAEDETSGTAGCEFVWPSLDDRVQLELFLFGSDLQWRLNGLDDRVRTPIEALTDWLKGRRQDIKEFGAGEWVPLLYRRAEGSRSNGIGFISAPEPRSGGRSLVTLDALPKGVRLSAQAVTASGPETVEGQLTEESRLDTRAAPLYIYRWRA